MSQYKPTYGFPDEPCTTATANGGDSPPNKRKNMNKERRMGFGDAMTELIRVTTEADNLHDWLHIPDAVYPSNSLDTVKTRLDGLQARKTVLVKALNNIMVDVESDVGRRGE